MKQAANRSQVTAAVKRFRRRRLIATGMLAVALYLVWFVLSGHYDAQHLALGAVSVGLVVFLNTALIFPKASTISIRRETAQLPYLRWWRFLIYIPWLLVEIVKANMYVAYLVLHPRLPIEPDFIQFSRKYQRGAAQVVLANSITLTPGTVTVELRDGNYVVHTLLPRLAGSLIAGRMQNRVAFVFAEPADPPPTVRWLHSVRELEL